MSENNFEKKFWKKNIEKFESSFRKFWKKLNFGKKFWKKLNFGNKFWKKIVGQNFKKVLKKNVRTKALEQNFKKVEQNFF